MPIRRCSDFVQVNLRSLRERGSRDRDIRDMSVTKPFCPDSYTIGTDRTSRDIGASGLREDRTIVRPSGLLVLDIQLSSPTAVQLSSEKPECPAGYPNNCSDFPAVGRPTVQLSWSSSCPAVQLSWISSSCPTHASSARLDVHLKTRTIVRLAQLAVGCEYVQGGTWKRLFL